MHDRNRPIDDIKMRDRTAGCKMRDYKIHGQNKTLRLKNATTYHKLKFHDTFHDLYSGFSGSMNTSDLKISLRRGDSSLEGVSAELRSATYFWSPVSHNLFFSNFYMQSMVFLMSSCLKLLVKLEFIQTVL